VYIDGHPIDFIQALLFVCYQQVQPSGKLQLSFKTLEPNGLILYNGGSTRSDFIALELYDGQLFFIINTGDKVERFPFGTTSRPLNDGISHDVRIERNDRTLILTLDGETRQHRFNTLSLS